MDHWSIRDSVDAETKAIWSAAAVSLCPGNPRARHSQRNNRKNWAFMDGGMIEGGVSVECDKCDWKQ